MPRGTFWESIRIKGDQAVTTVRRLVHEGNVRRIVIRQGSRTIAEFPVTAGVVGAVFAPTLAAVGALAALLTDCTIDVERAEPGGGPAAAPRRKPRRTARS